MKIPTVLGSLAILKLISCAGNSPHKSFKTSSKTSNTEVWHEVASYLDNPFTNLEVVSTSLRDVVSTLPLKVQVKEYFNIPELDTDDIVYNEKELRYFLPYQKFAKNPDYIYRALRAEFLYGNKFKVLIPHLIKYLERVDPETVRSADGIKALIRHEQFSYFFEHGTGRLREHADILFTVYLLCLQDYVRSRSGYLESILNVLSDYHESHPEYALAWIVTAFKQNMPEDFFKNFPVKFWNGTSVIWTQLIVHPRQRPRVFQILTSIIEKYAKGADKEFFTFLNMIRFGPEFNENLEPKRFPLSRKINIWICALIANKMEIATKFLNDISIRLFDNYSILDRMFSTDERPPEFEKLLLHLLPLSNQNFRRHLYDQPKFSNILAKYYQVESIDWGRMDIKIELKLPEMYRLYSNHLKIPERLTFDRRIYDIEEFLIVASNVPLNFNFVNIEAFEKFIERLLWEFKDLFFSINMNNLRLILKSERTWPLLKNLENRTRNSRSLFKVNIKDVLNVVDEPIPNLPGVFGLTSDDHSEIFKFRTFEELERFEKLTGTSVSSLIMAEYDYFKYRHIFKYIIEKGQSLPSDLSADTLALIHIECPNIISN